MRELDLTARTSLALHRAVAQRLRADPQLIERARDRIAGGSGLHPYYAERWRDLLARPLEELCAVLESTSEDAISLRQTTPFAGVLDSATRWQIWRSVRVERR